MLDHIGITCRDYPASKAFYLKALAPLGIQMVMEVTPEMTGGPSHAGLGANMKPFFWFGEGPAQSTLHIALAAPNRAAVDAFYAAAMEAGATDNGPPGLRPMYHPNYYGAFVIDPNGVNLEAVCHTPE
jgi:catechol 2,3-dioxygenase-like lactoylglutathione lyase family enzyme